MTKKHKYEQINTNKHKYEHEMTQIYCRNAQNKQKNQRIICLLGSHVGWVNYLFNLPMRTTEVMQALPNPRLSAVKYRV